MPNTIITEIINRVVIDDPENRVIVGEVVRITPQDRERVIVGDQVRVVNIAEQGPPGAPGTGDADETYIASIAISGHRIVALEEGELRYATNDSLDDAALTLGLSMNAAVMGDDVTVRRAGVVVNGGWSWVAGLPVWLGTNGHMTQTPPTSPAVFSLIVGQAVASDALNVRIDAAVLL